MQSMFDYWANTVCTLIGYSKSHDYLFLTNQSALFRRILAILLHNLFMTSAPGNSLEDGDEQQQHQPKS